MIVKELDPLAPGSGPRVQAGRRAEEQMAFYLRRAFADDPKIVVLNGLRVERKGEIAQVDHLVLSTHGLILIESKSVTTQIRVNAQEEWTRQVGQNWQGMPSPLLQVERQANLIRSLLNDHVDLFFRKVLAFQFTFTSVPFDGLVAISDTGVIDRPKGFAVRQVLKADQVVPRIQEIHADYRRGSSLFSLSLKDAGAEFSDKTVQRLTEFLLQRHSPQPLPPSSSSPPVRKPQNRSESNFGKPRSRAPGTSAHPQGAPSPQPPKVPVQSQPDAKKACRTCGSGDLTIVYGKYGYYFKCGACGGNTPIKVTCANGDRARITKQGREFYVVCPDRSEPQLFYVNPESTSPGSV
ncbi:NERD domain-containing protein [Leptolyngbya sp. KIOST-1]|uniref:NERD domain-containing protein n=1 Tax=Leptolyngbya sp. KIOST-1 TaxID=1229172 RepID=UPI00068B9F67|nr:NERD domain-containing protein [Leptolyngbya sp. KIOST-1]